MYSDNTLCLFPEWFIDFEVDTASNIDFVGFPELDSGSGLPDGLARFLETYNDPVIFTPGTGFRNCRYFFEEALRTLGEINKPGIFLSKGIKSLPIKMPENVYTADYIPLEKLLDRCSLIVHHGGIGTTSQALIHAVPQIILFHQGLDQKNNAEIAEKFGLCRKCQFERMTSKIIIKYAKELLTDDVQDKCLNISNKLRLQSSKKAFINNIAKYLFQQQ